MISSWVLLVSIGVVLISSFHSASGLTCYTCSSDTVKSCGDPFKTTTVPKVPCEGINHVCVKQVLPLVGTLRGCGIEDQCNLFTNETSDCTICRLDNCNSGFTNFASGVSLLLPIFAIFGYLFKI